jgi:hypothetical protein
MEKIPASIRWPDVIVNPAFEDSGRISGKPSTKVDDNAFRFGCSRLALEDSGSRQHPLDDMSGNVKPNVTKSPLTSRPERNALYAIVNFFY